jgi:hypothetical protein
MEFETLLAQFRLLGGRAVNVDLRLGPRGRGLFAIDPALPVDIHVPMSLMVASRWAYVDSTGQLRINKAANIDAEVVSFYENYHQYFGWGAGGLKAARQHQKDIQSLPGKVKNFMLVLGWTEASMRAPTVESCLKQYLINRQIRVESESRMMPIAELINHDHGGLSYTLEAGVRFSGVFKDELLAVYHRQLDAFHFFRNYHFPSPANTVLSCDVKIDVPTIGLLQVSRDDQWVQENDGGRSPSVTKNATGIHLSFVELANQKQPLLPRKIATDLFASLNILPSMANDLFDGLLAHHRQVLLDFIQACRQSDKAVTRALTEVANEQLAILANAPEWVGQTV